MILADKIIKLRKQKGWSQEEFAEKLDVSRQSVSKWETAQSSPDLNKIVIKDMQIDSEKYIAIIDEKKIDLTTKEFELLKMLSAQPDQIFTREQILKGVWGYDFYGDARTVDVTIRRLREKIEKNPAEPKYVQTRRGMGYYISV